MKTPEKTPDPVKNVETKIVLCPCCGMYGMGAIYVDRSGYVVHKALGSDLGGFRPTERCIIFFTEHLN